MNLTERLALLGKMDYALSVSYPVALGATATIPTLISATLPSNLVRIAILPHVANTGTIYYAIGGAASVATSQIPAGGENIPVTKTVADTIQLYGQAGDYATVQVFTARS